MAPAGYWQHYGIAAARGGGQPLPERTRGKFEAAVGGDLGGVRVHTGAGSAASAGAVGARAYTVGSDIHFGAGQYDPASREGERLLAHEVAHTVQQAGGAPRVQHKLAVSQPGDAAELEADRAADAMVSGTPVAIAPAGASIARKKDDDAGDDAKGSSLSDYLKMAGDAVTSGIQKGAAAASKGMAAAGKLYQQAGGDKRLRQLMQEEQRRKDEKLLAGPVKDALPGLWNRYCKVQEQAEELHRMSTPDPSAPTFSKHPKVRALEEACDEALTLYNALRGSDDPQGLDPLVRAIEKAEGLAAELQPEIDKHHKSRGRPSGAAVMKEKLAPVEAALSEAQEALKRDTEAVGRLRGALDNQILATRINAAWDAGTFILGEVPVLGTALTAAGVVAGSPTDATRGGVDMAQDGNEAVIEHGVEKAEEAFEHAHLEAAALSAKVVGKLFVVKEAYEAIHHAQENKEKLDDINEKLEAAVGAVSADLQRIQGLCTQLQAIKVGGPGWMAEAGDKAYDDYKMDDPDGSGHAKGGA